MDTSQDLKATLTVISDLSDFRAMWHWDGLYGIERDSGFWRVLLHSPTGPKHWMNNDGEPACRCCMPAR